MGLAVGQSSLMAEQRRLVREVANGPSVLAGGSSAVDVLIATPGRLVDHLKSTAHFTLQHLRWLIVDEADRLMDQPFQDWLSHVLASLDPHPGLSSPPSSPSSPLAIATSK